MRKAFLKVLAISAFGVGCGAGSDEADKNTDLQTSKPSITKPCAADDTFTVWCGYKNPEDLAATPDRKYLLNVAYSFGDDEPKFGRDRTVAKHMGRPKLRAWLARFLHPWIRYQSAQ